MLKHYLVLSLKVLMRRKFFTFISIFGISFTLLVLLVVTAVLDHSFAPMAPESRQHLTLVSRDAAFHGPGNQSCCGASLTLYERYARGLPGVERLSIYTRPRPLYTYHNDRKIEVRVKRTDAEFWRILDFTFLEGRPYSEAEVREAASVAVINSATRDQFFESAKAIGRRIELDNQVFTVVGVVENVPELRDVPYADLWAPHTTMRVNRGGGLNGGFSAIALASSPAALPQIREEFNARLARIPPEELNPRNPGAFTAVVAPFETRFEHFARQMGPFGNRYSSESQAWRLSAVLAGAALLFVLLPTVNLVNINVSRILERASEIGVRKAFGASSRTLVGQFVVENIILTVAGGLIGLIFSVFVLRAINESGAIRFAQLAVNLRVFTYGMLLALVFGVVSGVYPAWRMSRLHPVDALLGGQQR